MKHTIASFADKSGIILSIFFIKDISEKHRTYQILTENEANLRALVENTGANIWSLDLEYKLVIGNEKDQQNVSVVSGKPIKQGECFLLSVFPEDILAE